MAEADPDPRGLHHRHEGEEHDDGTGRAPAHRARRATPGPAGTSGVPPWDPAGGPAPDYWIVETSSFQVPDLQNGPSVVAVTSLSPDHLDWHGTVERYYADKLSLCTKPGVTLALADGARRGAAARRPGSSVRTSAGSSGAEVERDARWSAALGLTGPHNAAQRLGGARRARGPRHPGRVRRGPAGRSGAGFRRAAQPLPLAGLGRGGRVRRRQPVDQRAAGAGGTAGLRRAPGGAARRWARPRARLRAARPDDRGSARHRRSSSPCRTTGHASGRPCATPRAAGSRCATPTSLDAAVEAAFDWAPAGGVVLLSPAAPSFGRFGDYRERSAAFAEAAGRLGTLS